MKRIVLVLSMFVGASSLAQDKPVITYRPDPEVIKKVIVPPSRFGKALFDLLEYQLTSDNKEAKYDAEFWFGGDFNRVWLELEGEHSFKNGSGSLDRADLYYSRLITAFWDFRVGVGTQSLYGDGSENRSYFVVRFQGLAPYWFEIDANLRVDTEGNTGADLEAEYDLLFTQRLILQTRFETAVYFSNIKDMGIGSGINSTVLGARLRYEFRREFAPYVGVEWTQFYGSTKDLRKSAGEDTSFVNLVAGIRMWF